MTQLNLKSSFSQIKQERRPLRIAMTIFVAAIAVVAFYLFLAVQLAAWQMYTLSSVIGLYCVLAWIAIRMIRRGEYDKGVWLVIIGMYIVFPAAALLIADIALIFGGVEILLVFVVANQGLSSQNFRRALVIGFGVGVVTAFFDLLPLDYRLYVPQIRAFVPSIAGAIILLLVVLAIRQAWAGNIRVRLVTSFLTLVIVPLLISGVIGSLIIRQAALTNVYNQLEAVATLKEDSIASWLGSLQDMLRVTLREKEPGLVNALNAIEQGNASDENLELLASVSRGLTGSTQRTEVFFEYFVLDRNGQVIISTNDNQVGKVFENHDFFKNGLLGEYVQPPQYSQSLGAISIVVSRPLQDNNGNVGGVLAGRANLQVLNALMLTDIGVGNTGETYLVRSNNALLTSSKFPGYAVGDTYIRTAGVNTAIQQRESGTAAYEGYRGTTVLSAYRWLPDLQLALVAEVEEDEALSAALTSTITNLGVAVGAAVLAVVVALFVTQNIATPLAELADAAEKITVGDLDVKVEIERQDEIGVLANTFNNMTTQLRETLESLEQQVADRTQALETSTEVSRRLSTILDQRQLVREVVEQLRSAFGYYHAHIYLYDDEKQNLVMAGGTGDAGRTMLARGHKIEKGRGLVGRAAETGEVVLIPDVSQAEGWLPNPLLPETKAEVAVPIIVGQEVLGVLDVQHNITNGLTAQDADLIQAVANQVGIAVQNAQAYEQAQRQAEREARIAAINQRIQSATSIDDVLKIAVQELGHALEAQHSLVELRTVELDDRLKS